MMDRNRLELIRAIDRLGLTAEQASFCDDATSERVVRQIARAFLSAEGRRWWWEVLKVPYQVIECSDGAGFEQIPRYVPESEDRCWFVVENDQDGPWNVLGASVTAVQKIVGECTYFEYYLVGKKMDWFICETHHNQLIVARVPDQ